VVLYAALALLLGLSACGRPTVEEEVSRWLSLEIERPEVVPAATEPSAPPALDADGMLLATFFPIPRTFISRGLDSGHPQDPFAIVQEGVEAPRVTTAREVLETAGIHFDSGAFACYFPASSALVVRQTPEEMELVEAYLMSLGPRRQPTVFTRIEIYELHEARAMHFLRSADGQPDHAPEHEAVGTLLRQGGARLVQSTRILSRSGQWSRHEDGYEVLYFVPPGSEDSEFGGPSSRRSGREVTRNVGTWLEIDPVIGVDNTTIDLNLTLEFHSADPTWHELPPGTAAGSSTIGQYPRFLRHTCKIRGIFRSGETRLIASWRPEGEPPDRDAETLLLVFLTPTIGFPSPPPAQ